MTFLGGKLIRDLKVMGTVAILDKKYADVVFLSVEIDAGRVGANAISSSTGRGKFLSYRYKISGGQDWLAILDRGTNAAIDQTEIRFAACRGSFEYHNQRL